MPSSPHRRHSRPPSILKVRLVAAQQHARAARSRDQPGPPTATPAIVKRRGGPASDSPRTASTASHRGNRHQKKGEHTAPKTGGPRLGSGRKAVPPRMCLREADAKGPDSRPGRPHRLGDPQHRAHSRKSAPAHLAPNSEPRAAFPGETLNDPPARPPPDRPPTNQTSGTPKQKLSQLFPKITAPARTRKAPLDRNAAAPSTT